ncbi:MAG: glycoside hydrolase family 3 N-terminal domain-containing protein [Pseudomonadota bacterium]
MRIKPLHAFVLAASSGLVLQACQAVSVPEPVLTNDPVEVSAEVPISSDPEIAALIADMTLDEKLAQLSCIWINKGQIFDENGDFSAEKMKANYPHGVGCFARPQDTMGMEQTEERKDVNDATVVRRMSARTPSETVELTNAVQQWMIEETRLGIPTLFHEEGLHGFQGRYATAFPQSIALASTFDPELLERVYSITAREIRVRGVHHVLSPVVDVALDPRWGRIEETFGEDPYLVSRMGVAAIKGFQGTGETIPDGKVLTTLKHMTGHGQPEAGMNVGPAQLPERVLREIFFPPFEAAVKEANAASVMASYNEIDGVPSHANSWLLNDVLRGEWGFDGVVVADYFAINELQVRHRLVDSLGAAGALAITSGVDFELPDGVAFYQMKEAVEAGDLDISVIDTAVERVLRMKKRGGVFDDPYANGEEADALTGNADARAVALEAAHKAAVLLKNQNDILPLTKADLTRVAIVGPNSDITVLGGYSDEPRQTISILDGFQAEFGGEVEITHAKGVNLTDNRSWWDDEVSLADRAENLAMIEDAVAAVEGADLIILAIGGDESTSREAWSETHLGDRDDITLIGEQTELVEALAATDIPMVGVIISGRPLALTDVEDHFDAILYGWQLGQETGTAVADLLMGHVSPSGKMPVSIPRNVGQIPVFYNYKPTARRGYAFTETSPLYAFGEGMSYTTFEISEPVLSQSEISTDGSTSVSVTVTNTGPVSADEVVQMYIRDEISSVTRPVMELKGFQRVRLAPGESQQVELPITSASLQFYDRDMRRVVEPGTFEIMVGSSSQSHKSTTLTVVE